MVDTNQFKIFEEFRSIKQNYETASLEKVPGLKRSQYMVIKMCEYYSDSKYLGTYIGNKKTLSNGSIDVPFYNIVNYRVALAKTATDLDIKDIQIISDNPKHQVCSMLLNREAYEWMKEAEFSKTLNDMGSTRPKYGGYLVKKTEKGGKLKIEVVRWTNTMTNQNKILAGPIVEMHPMSPVELADMKDVWENTDDVLRAWRKIKVTDRPSTIEVYEIVGEFPVSVFNNAQPDTELADAEVDEFTYSLQRYYIAQVGGKDYLMYSEQLSGELSDYYEYLSWEDNGYGLGRGVIEDSEEAQVWTNDAVINESIAMTLAGRVGIKTTSKKVGQNILEHDHGKIYELEAGADINSFSLAPGALGEYQNQIEKWRMQADNVTSSYNAVTGEQPPSGTPYSQTALLNQVATKPFDYKREEWGVHLTKLFDKWVVPFLIKKIKKEHILVSEFSDAELQMIDESFAVYNTNNYVVNAVLNDQNVTPADQAASMQGYKNHIQKQGKRRFINVPDDYFKEVESKVTVITTGEQKNKAVILQSIDTIMQRYVSTFNPQTGQFGATTDPFLMKLFREAIELANTGISPISLGLGKETKQVPQGGVTPAPQPQPQGGAVPQPSSPALAGAVAPQ